jgi:hypothetical protein
MDSLSSDDLTMGGFELTTFYGHARVGNTRGLTGVRPGERTWATSWRKLRRHADSAIAHPMPATRWHRLSLEYMDICPAKQAS